MSDPNIVKRWRIQVALWAWAYEKHDDSIVDDATFDARCARVASTLHISTDNAILDDWFRKEFAAHTGSWVHKHPDTEKLELLYQRL